MPSISPDGKWVAYYDDQNQVIVQQINGSETLLLLRNSIPIGPVTWSPDGSQILVLSGAQKPSGLFIVPITGGEPRRTGLYGPASCWRPDGSQVVASDATATTIYFWNPKTGESKSLLLQKKYPNEFLRDLHCLSNNVLLATLTKASGLTLLRIDAEGKMTELLSEDKFSEILSTPDGNRLYFLGGDSDTEIYSVAAAELLKGIEPKLFSTLSYEGNIWSVSASNNGTFTYEKTSSQSNLWLSKLNADETQWNISRLTTGTWSVSDPAISPNASRVAVCVRKETGDLYTMPLEGGSMKQITFSGSGCRGPAWSPDGNRIAFYSYTNGRLSLNVVAAEGGEVKTLIDKEVSFSGNMTWSPGNEILYQKSGNRQYYFMNPDTRKTEPLFDNGFHGWWFTPRYSPDGSHIAFQANFPPRHGIFIINRRDRSMKFLGESEIYVHRWSDDGKWLYGFSRDTKELYKVNAVTGRAIELPALQIDSEYKVTSLDVASTKNIFIIHGAKVESDVWNVDSDK
jgi:Tol biopolymer transport system component